MFGQHELFPWTMVILMSKQWVYMMTWLTQSDPKHALQLLVMSSFLPLASCAVPLLFLIPILLAKDSTNLHPAPSPHRSQALSPPSPSRPHSFRRQNAKAFGLGAGSSRSFTASYREVHPIGIPWASHDLWSGRATSPAGHKVIAATHSCQ